MEKVQKGGGVSTKNQKVQNSKFGLFDKRGGGRLYFHFFPNINVDFKCLGEPKKVSFKVIFRQF